MKKNQIFGILALELYTPASIGSRARRGCGEFWDV